MAEMVTDDEVKAVLDAVNTHGTNTDCGQMVVRMAADRDALLALLTRVVTQNHWTPEKGGLLYEARKLLKEVGRGQ